MAESQAPPTDQSVLEYEGKKLKYLDFVQVAAVYVVVCCSTLYDYAKQNSGPLRPGVHTVEGTVKAVLGPVYEKFHNLPSDLLEFIDRKVEKSIIELDHQVPDVVKQVCRQGWAVAQRAPAVAQEVAWEVQQAGLVDTASNIAKIAYEEYEPTAKKLYAKYEPIAEQYAVTSWRTLNGLPLFSQATHIMIPTFVYWADKYNQAVAFLAADTGNNYAAAAAAACYLPLVPIHRIAKTFGPDNHPPPVSA